ncbi:vWA domain-containing protein [Paractinoplanes durhamensis]
MTPVGPGDTFDLPVVYAPVGNSATSVNQTLTVTTDPVDTGAGVVAGHNRQVVLTAVAASLEVHMLLDVSGSMGWDFDGNSLPDRDPNSRLAQLKDGLKPFLGKLAHFGTGHGDFGVFQFPQGTPGNDTTYEVIAKQAIPDMFSDELLKHINDLVPFNSTPMGDGLNHLVGAGASVFSAETGNRRWIILFSDGAHNSGQHSPTEFVPPNGSVLREKKIHLFAIGYGRKPQSNVQFDLLTQLQTGSFEGGAVNGGNIIAVERPNTSATDLAAALSAPIKAQLTVKTGTSRDPDAVFLSGQGEARHDIQVTPYDGRAAFTINWNTPQDGRLELALLTPDCGIITADSAGHGPFPNIRFQAGQRSSAYYVDADFMAAHPGTWTMLVTVPPIIGLAAAGPVGPPQVYERYTYDVLMESTLLLRLEMDRAEYFAGDPIGVTAKLTARGLPVRKQSVVLSTLEPGQAFANWLAAQVVPEEALEEARQRLAGKDTSPAGIKGLGAEIAGLMFDPFTQPGVVTMNDVLNAGRYQATVAGSGVPERRDFYVTAIGTTEDGVEYRREAQASVQVLVRPEAASTVLSIQQTAPGTATVVAIPKDRFGNVIIAEPLPGGLVQIVGSGFETSGPLVNNVDGSYQQEITFPPGTAPSVGLESLGEPVVTVRPIPPLDDLYFVDEVLSFTPGAIKDANTHADPAAALGTVVAKPTNQFLALGGHGRLTVAIRDHAIVATRSHDDVTVFVDPGHEGRGYRVEAFDVRAKRWVPLGESPGLTQSFRLRDAGLDATRGIRVTDTSGRIRDDAGLPLTSPGACLTGVGVLKIERHVPYGGRFCRWCSWWRWWPAPRRER